MRDGTLHANVLNMWSDYGVPPVADHVPASELRLVSGLPFGLWVINGNGPQEGTVFAAVAGDPAKLAEMPNGPLVRMHSACIFSEVGDDPSFDAWLKKGVKTASDGLRFGQNPSNECDCREQRVTAQRRIAFEGGVYLDLAEQEGRGWGLDIKREIYRLYREEGLDTADACVRLGLEFDVRRYDHCAEFLLHTLGLSRVQLMSNNPRKAAPLRAAGIEVVSVPLLAGVTLENVDYLRVKRDKGGHHIPSDAELAALLRTA